MDSKSRTYSEYKRWQDKMKRLIALFAALVVSTVSAQTVQTTPNVISTTAVAGLPGVQQSWSGGFIATTSTGQGFSGGNVPAYNPTTNQFMFGYTQGTFAYQMAINSALAGSGVQVGGIQYGFSYLNQDTSRGTFSVGVQVKSNTGAVLENYTHNLPQTTTGWTPWAQTQTFTNPYTLANLGTASMDFTGRDDRFWAGYYGPQFKDPYLRLTYTAEVPVVTNPTFGDDTYVAVPLRFGFPYYGRTFTNSWMHSNGVVSFLDPAVPVPGASYNPASWAYCCGDQPTVTKPEFSFMIAPLWTDLYPVASSTFRTEGTSTYQKYFWNNIAEISNMNNLNTFSVELRPTGFIGINYEKVNIQNQNTWVGTTGDTTLGQINQRFYGVPGLDAHLSTIQNWSMTDTPADLCTINPLSSPSCPGYTSAMCSSNPLYSPVCPGYQQAYFTQQCSINVLFNPACPGYAVAYHDQQCSINPLYATTCPGYQQAYHNQQCSTNPLYATDCTNYTTAKEQCDANPLNNSYCPGYETALSTCQVNPLSNSLCSGYASATLSCSSNPLSYSYCPGYQTASSQCSANQLTYSYCPSYQSTLQYCSTDPLSNTMCPTYSQSLTTCQSNPLSNSYCPAYQTAVTSCSANALSYSYCPGYRTALDTCSTNPLSNNLCSGYQTATTQCNSNPLLYTYCPAYKTALATCSTNPQSNAMCPGYSVVSASSTSTSSSTTTTADTTTSSDTSTSSTASALVTSPTATVTTPVQSPVQQALSTPSTTSATSVTSVTSVIAAPAPGSPAGATSMASVSNSQSSQQGPKEQGSKEQNNKEQGSQSNKEQSGPQGGGNRGNATASSGPSGNRQNAREPDQKQAEARAQAANENMKNATRLEDQVAAQGAVVNAMAFVPGFSTYQNSIVPDINQLRMARQYSTPPVDNNRTQRLLGGAQEQRWNEMVNSQYNNYNRGN